MHFIQRVTVLQYTVPPFATMPSTSCLAKPQVFRCQIVDEDFLALGKPMQPAERLAPGFAPQTLFPLEGSGPLREVGPLSVSGNMCLGQYITGKQKPVTNYCWYLYFPWMVASNRTEISGFLLTAKNWSKVNGKKKKIEPHLVCWCYVFRPFSSTRRNTCTPVKINNYLTLIRELLLK